MVASGRLGCCCIVGCPSNSINPMNPGKFYKNIITINYTVNENAIEERPDVMVAQESEDLPG